MVNWKSRKDRSERNRKLMVYFMGFIMVSSVFGVIFFGYNQPDQSTVEYNGQKYKQRNNIWITEIDNNEVYFAFLPYEVEDIELSFDIKQKLIDPIEIDITSDSESELNEYIALAQHHLLLSLNPFDIYVRTGFVNESEFEVPIITCDDSTARVPVIYFSLGNETKVFLKEDCIIAQAKDGFDLLKIKDRLLAEILGIVDE